MEWTSGFPEITETCRADAFEMISRLNFLTIENTMYKEKKTGLESEFKVSYLIKI